MATSSIVMLSDISMERLYLSQPPGWNDLQRLPFPSNQSTTIQGPDGRSSQQMIRSCYDKLLHHIYDMNSPLTPISTASLNQINEQLKIAAEYCQLKIFEDDSTVYLHADRFFLQVKIDLKTRLPVNVVFCITSDQSNHEESISCTRMLRALNEKQYRLFRKHLSGLANMFTILAPGVNNDKRVGYLAYKTLQQDIERLTKTTIYGKLLNGFEPMCEGLPIRVQVNAQSEINPSLPSHVRIVLTSSTAQHHLPTKSIVHFDEKTNQIVFDGSNLKLTTLATGHFLLEIDEEQAPFTLLQSYAQEISRITNFNELVSNTKPFNYLASLMPKSKYISRYQWYISHDQQAISVRQIPFTNVKHLLDILNFIRQQIYLTKYLHFYFNLDEEQEFVDDEMNVDQRDIYLELSFLSTTLLSITSAQSSNLSTFLLNLSNIEALPWLSYRQQQKDVALTEEKASLLKIIEQLLQEENFHSVSSPIISIEPSASFNQFQQKHSPDRSNLQPKLNRRLSCGPPIKASWRPATSIRRTHAACLTILPKEHPEETVEKFFPHKEEPESDMNTDDVNDDDDDIFLPDNQADPNGQNSSQQPGLSRASLSLNPAVLSRCTSVSSTQSASTPTLFGLTPSTPYPSSNGNSNGNVFFPFAKHVSTPDYNPPSPSFSLGPLNASAFLSASASTGTNPTPPVDNNSQTQMKKKRPRSDQLADDLVSPMGSNGAKLTTTNDQTNVKRPKKPSDKQLQTNAGQQFSRQKSTFKVTDSPTPSLMTQTSGTSPDDTPADMKPIKVVIKRVGDGANTSTDDLQQQTPAKPRKKQVTQATNNFTGAATAGGKKSAGNTPNSTPSPSVVVKTESFEMSQFNVDNNHQMSMNSNEAVQQAQRPRPSSAISNSSSSSLSPSVTSQPRTTPQQPPIVLKIQRSKVYSGQDTAGPGGTTSNTGSVPTATQSTQNLTVVSKEPNKSRPRSSTGGPALPKQSITSPTNPTTKLTSPSPTPPPNPLAPANPLAPSFRIPKKSSTNDVTAKPKPEPGTINTNVNINTQKPSAPTSSNSSSDLSKSMNKLTSPNNSVRPSQPSTQIGSWQSPPTQQPSRFHQNRPRSSWNPPQPQQQGSVPRGRAPITATNVSGVSGVHPPFPQQPRSIMKKPSANELPGADSLYMPSSDLIGFNEQRAGSNYPQTSSFISRTGTPTEMADDNDDDASPQAQLVIDTGNNPVNQMNLPYSMGPGSSSTSAMDSCDSSHDNQSMSVTSQHHHPQANLYRDEQSSVLD